MLTEEAEVSTVAVAAGQAQSLVTPRRTSVPTGMDPCASFSQQLINTTFIVQLAKGGANLALLLAIEGVP